ncbi:integrase, catalytic region, zinc finger, CCHC-type containing protein [Tanacetum coccineum]|uniref:Integrase, catalytic region, zinc finger, CCHC-type containing protein n=1 Tax=Tanacetum coccineum TaxID=301880 RepID=A0ABQ5DW77_9ASTR
MMTLADKAILSGADNRPPMLEKDMYDSWKSRMELYMMNRQHGRMILESVENGPLIWPTIEENGVTRPKKYFELSATEAIQADCDIKETNIILQGLPPEVYALVINHKVAKELWERIQLLMQGTSLTKQERECKLYDEFDKTYTPRASGSNSGKQRTVICYNCKGEGHMSKQCIKPKRKWDDSWFKDKVLLVQSQANGQNLHEEELAFLANPKNCISHHTDSHYSICCLSKPNDLDAIITLIVMKLNSICQDLLHGKFISYGSDAPQAGYHNQDNVDNNRLYQAVFRRCRRSDIKCYNHSETEITSDSNIIPLFSVCDRITTGKTFRILTHSAQQDALILSVIEH